MSQYKHQTEKSTIYNFIKKVYQKYQSCFTHSEGNISKLVSQCKHQNETWINNFSKVSLPWIPNLLPRTTSFEEKSKFKFMSRLQNLLQISNIEIGIAILLSNCGSRLSFPVQMDVYSISPLNHILKGISRYPYFCHLTNQEIFVLKRDKWMPSLNRKLLDLLCKPLQCYLFTEKHVKHLLVTSPHLTFITKRVTMRNTMMIIMISRWTDDMNSQIVEVSSPNHGLLLLSTLNVMLMMLMLLMLMTTMMTICA